MRADKEKIREQCVEIETLNLKLNGAYSTIRRQDEQIKELNCNYLAMQKKYADLLEKYIAMMERAVKLDEREAD